MLPTFAQSFLKPKLKRQRPFSTVNCPQVQPKRNEEFMDVVDYADTQDDTETEYPTKRQKSDDRVQVIRIPPLENGVSFSEYLDPFHFDSSAAGGCLAQLQRPHVHFVHQKDKFKPGTSTFSLFPSTQTSRKQSFIVKGKEMRAFFRLLEDEIIQDFLEADRCIKISDKYLIAMVFAYFKRADIKIREYTRTNFFVGLYLANDMEEDEEEDKYEIFPWALGQKWQDKFPRFLRKRDLLWAKINYMALVSKRCCEEIMAIDISHAIWNRNRPQHHAGAIRGYMKDPNDDGYPRGPHASPRHCPDCNDDSQYDSASPGSASWYISSGESSPSSDDIFDEPVKSRFDMNRLKNNLPKEDDDAWPSVEE